MSVQRLEVEHLDVRYDDRPVVQDVGLRLRDGAIGCLLGPSGCGKTTVLRAIAGFVTPSRGTIRIGGTPVHDRGVSVPPERRGVGMVFQDLALFPHLRVADNIGFGLRAWRDEERRARIDELLALVGMQRLRSAYPHELSGGEQQRVALARAMAPRPGLLLLDEPFSSMDVELREQLARDVRGILEREQVTAVLVTHHQHEAFAMADEICVMHAGRIQQRATSYELYHRPANRFVADFVGEGVIVPGRVGAGRRVETDLGTLADEAPGDFVPGDAVDVLIRPDDVLRDEHDGMVAEVVERAFRGSMYLYTLKTRAGIELLSEMPSHLHFEIGEEIGIALDLRHLAVFRNSRGQIP